MARSGLGTLLNAFVTRRAIREGVDDAQDKGAEESSDATNLRRDPKLYRYSNPKNGPVATGDTMGIPAGSGRPRELLAGRRPNELLEAPVSDGRGQHLERGNEVPVARTGDRGLSRRVRRELAAVGAGAGSGAALSRTRETFAPATDDGATTPTLPAGTSAVERGRENPVTGLRSHPAIHPEERDVDLAAPADKNVSRGKVMGHSTALPNGVVEATTTYDGQGNPVFEIWRPPTTARAQGDDPEEYR
jgi:hypothetical protein